MGSEFCFSVFGLPKRLFGRIFRAGNSSEIPGEFEALAVNKCVGYLMVILSHNFSLHPAEFVWFRCIHISMSEPSLKKLKPSESSGEISLHGSLAYWVLYCAVLRCAEQSVIFLHAQEAMPNPIW